MRLRYTQLFITALIITFSCNSTGYIPDLKTHTFSNQSQQFTLVSFYKHMPAYVKHAKANHKEIERIYNQLVYNPIW